MSISSNARASQIARNVKSGQYLKNAKFHNYGSVVEDSIFAQQRAADARLALIKAQRKIRATG